jgi:hypothetical protein
VLTEVGGRIRAPRNIISGRGDAANLEMKNVIENCCGHALALPFLPAAVALAAVVGAARAHSDKESSGARTTFEKVANNLTLRASLGDRVAERTCAAALPILRGSRKAGKPACIAWDAMPCSKLPDLRPSRGNQHARRCA